MFEGKYVIWSYEHAAWWRSASAGYCTNLMGAGLYEKAEADEIVRGANEFSDRKNEIASPAEAEWQKLLASASAGTMGEAIKNALALCPSHAQPGDAK